MDNPIHKVITGSATDLGEWTSKGLTGPGRVVFLRSWVATCPVCSEEVHSGNYYSSSSRKKAKDALHKHKLKVHAEPGG